MSDDTVRLATGPERSRMSVQDFCCAGMNSVGQLSHFRCIEFE